MMADFDIALKPLPYKGRGRGGCPFSQPPPASPFIRGREVRGNPRRPNKGA